MPVLWLILVSELGDVDAETIGQPLSGHGAVTLLSGPGAFESAQDRDAAAGDCGVMISAGLSGDWRASLAWLSRHGGEAWRKPPSVHLFGGTGTPIAVDRGPGLSARQPSAACHDQHRARGDRRQRAGRRSHSVGLIPGAQSASHQHDPPHRPARDAFDAGEPGVERQVVAAYSLLQAGA